MANEIAILDATAQAVEKTMNKIKQFQIIIKKNLIEGIDYGTIPGCGNKPTLLNPGAQKTLMLFGLNPVFEILNEIEDFEKGLFHYKIKCHVYSNSKEIAQGIGSCNSWEDKYRYRWVFDKDVPKEFKLADLMSKTKFSRRGNPYKVYRIPNDDTATQANTILKMAEKRALVHTALFVGSLSDTFTQDIEDNPDYYSNTEPDQPTQETQVVEKQQGQKLVTPAQDKKYIQPLLKSTYLSDEERKRYTDEYNNGMTSQRASDLIKWWWGDKEKNIVGEREKREVNNVEQNMQKSGLAQKSKPKKERTARQAEIIALARSIGLKSPKELIGLLGKIEFVGLDGQNKKLHPDTKYEDVLYAIEHIDSLYEEAKKTLESSMGADTVDEEEEL